MGQVAVAKIGDRDDQRRGLVQRQPEGDLVRGSEGRGESDAWEITGPGRPTVWASVVEAEPP